MRVKVSIDGGKRAPDVKINRSAFYSIAGDEIFEHLYSNKKTIGF